jgi:putative ABC transport system ATP-binding protein
VIFADEPTGNLDSHASGEVLSFMRRAVTDFGQSIVMVTHDPSAASHADAVLFLADGRIVDEMTEPTAQRVLDRIKAFGD